MKYMIISWHEVDEYLAQYISYGELKKGLYFKVANMSNTFIARALINACKECSFPNSARASELIFFDDKQILRKFRTDMDSYSEWIKTLKDVTSVDNFIQENS